MEGKKRMKIVCLHGFRTSGSFLKKQLSKWDPSIFAHFDLGASLSALLLGYQAQGKVLKDHPPMVLFVSISGSKFRDPSICEVAYKDLIKVKSVHFIGAKDWLRLPSEEFATAFDAPLILSHPQGHTVPRLDDEAVYKLSCWTKEIIEAVTSKEEDCSSDQGENNGEAQMMGKTESQIEGISGEVYNQTVTENVQDEEIRVADS